MKTENELIEIKTALSKQHKPIYTLVVPINDDETEFATIYLKKADRMIMSMLNKLIEGGDMYKAVEAYLKATYIGGDELTLITTNDDALMACESSIAEMIQRKQATLKKN
jgi:hypothetical protein